MAMSSARCQNRWILKCLCVWTIVFVACARIPTAEAKKPKHPPVVAFFQGHCNENFCDQKCREIDGGGFACECYRGYKLNHDGITCTEISSHSDVPDAIDLQAPEVVKILNIKDEDENTPNVKLDAPSKPKTDINLLSLDGKSYTIYEVPTDKLDSSDNAVREDSRAPEISSHPDVPDAIDLQAPEVVKILNVKEDNVNTSSVKLDAPPKHETDINLLSLDGKSYTIYEVPTDKLDSSDNAVREDSRAPGIHNALNSDVDSENSDSNSADKVDTASEHSTGAPVIHLSLDNQKNTVLTDPEIHPQSIKIETFDQKPSLPSLEIDSLRTEDASHLDEVQELVPHPLPKYSVKKEKHKTNPYIVSDSRGVRCDEFSCLNNGKCVDDGTVYRHKLRCDCLLGTFGEKCEKGVRCDEFSCLNNGKCVDDGTVYRHKLRCDCLLGTFGEKCEKEVEVRYPKFYGNSYLALPVLKNGYKTLDILIEFKPTAKYGLLFFSSEFEDAKTDFFSVTLIDAYIEFRYDCGTGMGILRSPNPVKYNEWNTLRIHREDNFATLWLNEDNPVQGFSKGDYTRLTLRLHMYVGGYEKIGILGNKLGTSKGFVGCVQQVVVNGYKYDMRKADLVGDAQFGVNVGECSEGVCDNVVCQNNGLCQVISADRHVCLCPVGTGGENCQHRTTVHIPEFQGYSYLEYSGLGRSALLFLEVELVIKPTKPDGVVLYNGFTLDRRGDFVSLALDRGHVEFRFDLGTGPAIIRSSEPISMNQWHWIKLSRTGMEGILEIDDKIAAIGQSLGAFTQLSLTQNLFIGGHRNFDETSQSANVTRSFDGCIQKIVINNRPLRLIDDCIFGVNIESCEHPCIGQPCLNNGECLPKKDVYTCYCPLGYNGINCQKKMDMDISTPRFTSDSYLQYSQKRIAKRIGGNKVDIKFSIRPETNNGLLFWSGPDIMLPTSDYIAIGFIDGALQFRYNLGSGEAVISYNNTRLFDGRWHYVHAQRDKQDGFLSVDGREIVEGSSKGSYTMLNTNKVLYIGGMPDVQQNTLRKFTSGYQGCLQDFVLGEDLPLQLLQVAETGRNVVPCL